MIKSATEFIKNFKELLAVIAIIISLISASISLFVKTDISKNAFHVVFNWDEVHGIRPELTQILRDDGRKMGAVTYLMWGYELPSEWGYRWLEAKYDPEGLGDNIDAKASKKWFDNPDRAEMIYTHQIRCVGERMEWADSDAINLMPSSFPFLFINRTDELMTDEDLADYDWDRELGNLVCFIGLYAGVKPYAHLAADFRARNQDELRRYVRNFIDVSPSTKNQIEQAVLRVLPKLKTLDYLLAPGS